MTDEEKDALYTIHALLTGLQTSVFTAAAAGGLTANRAELLRREAKALNMKVEQLTASKLG